MPEPSGPERISYQGKMIEVVEKPMKIGEKEVTFEIARRAPGTRLIIPTSDGNILLTKEFRSEINGYDYRLPGGKVFDTLTEYEEFRKSARAIAERAKIAAAKEAREEVGIEATSLELSGLSKCGATIEWDLYYFVVTEFSEHKQELEAGEVVEIVPTTREEARSMCLDGRIQEDRSALMLLRYLNK